MGKRRRESTRNEEGGGESSESEAKEHPEAPAKRPRLESSEPAKNGKVEC